MPAGEEYTGAGEVMTCPRPVAPSPPPPSPSHVCVARSPGLWTEQGSSGSDSGTGSGSGSELSYAAGAGGLETRVLAVADRQGPIGGQHNVIARARGLQRLESGHQVWAPPTGAGGSVILS